MVLRSGLHTILPAVATGQIPWRSAGWHIIGGIGLRSAASVETRASTDAVAAISLYQECFQRDPLGFFGFCVDFNARFELASIFPFV